MRFEQDKASYWAFLREISCYSDIACEVLKNHWSNSFIGIGFYPWASPFRHLPARVPDTEDEWGEYFVKFPGDIVPIPLDASWAGAPPKVTEVDEEHKRSIATTPLYFMRYCGQQTACI